MTKLNWYKEDGVAHFREKVSNNIPNSDGILLIGNKYGKVTYITYGNLIDNYKKFQNKKIKENNEKIEIYTYTVFQKKKNIELKDILIILQQALYNNPFYNTAIKIAQLPKFGIFNCIYKEYYFETKDDKKAYEQFITYKEICDLNNFSDKIEIKLTENITTKHYLIFLKTMFYFDIEYKIIEKFASLKLGKYLNDDYEIVNNYGVIIDEEPII